MLEQVRNAVSFVPSSAPWAERFKVLACLSDLGDEGLDIAASWLSWDKSKVAETLRGIRGRHRITLGSLYHVARTYGYTLPRPSATFTPSLIVSQPYLDTLPTGSKLLAVKSPKGTGKAEVLKTITGNILVIGHRRTLLRQMAQRLGVVYYSDVTPEELPNQSRLAITLDSLTKIASGRLPNQVGTVIIDEISQVLRHLSGTTLRHNRHNVLVTLSAILRKAQRIIILDADLRDLDRDFVALLSGSQTVVSLLNDYTPPVSRVVHRHGSHASILAELAQAQGPTFVACATKAEADTLARYLGDEVLKVTSETTRDPETKESVARINDVLGTKFRFLVASPSLGTGIDITVPCNVFLFGADGFEGLCAGDLSQALARVRNPLETHTYVPLFHRRRSTNPYCLRTEALALGQCLIDYDEDGKRVVSPLTWEPAYLDYWSKVTALHNASTNNLEQSFYELLSEEGCSIVDLQSSDPEAKADYRAASDLAKRLALESVLTALPLTEERRDELGKVAEPSPEERAALMRDRIEELFEVVTPTTVELYDEGRFEDRLTLFGDVFETPPTGEEDKEALSRGSLVTDVEHRRERATLAFVLLESYFSEGFDKPGWATEETKQLLKVHKTRLCLLFGFGATSPTIALRNLTKKLGLGLVSTGKKTIEGKVQRCYQLNGVEEMRGVYQRREKRTSDYLKYLEGCDF
jgi:hypothetical protein